MDIILRLGNDNKGSLTVPSREEVALEIESLSLGLVEVFNPLDQEIAYWTRVRMARNGSRIRLLTYWLYFSQDDTLNVLREKLLKILDVMLRGHLHYLDEILEIDSIGPPEFSQKKFSKVLIHSSMAAYFILPVATFFFVAVRWNVQLGGIFQAVASLLYLLWVVFGFFTFSDSLSLESRTLLADVIKTILGRRQ